MSKSLIAVTEDAMALERLIMESGGELCPALEEWLEEIGTNLAQKADTYSFSMARFDASAEMLKAKAEQYTAAARTLQNTVTRMRDRIKVALQMLGGEIRGNDIGFRLQGAAPKIVIDQAALPREYLIVETTYLPDRKLITKDLKSGKEIPGVTSSQNFALREFVNK